MGIEGQAKVSMLGELSCSIDSFHFVSCMLDGVTANRWKPDCGSLKGESWERAVGLPMARLMLNRMTRIGKRKTQVFCLLEVRY